MFCLLKLQRLTASFMHMSPSIATLFMTVKEYRGLAVAKGLTQSSGFITSTCWLPARLCFSLNPSLSARR